MNQLYLKLGLCLIIGSIGVKYIRYRLNNYRTSKNKYAYLIVGINSSYMKWKKNILNYKEKNLLISELKKNPNINKFLKYRICIDYKNLNLDFTNEINEIYISMLDSRLLNDVKLFNSSRIDLSLAINTILRELKNYHPNYYIIKTDIVSAYESVKKDLLFNFLKNDILISNKTINRIDYLFNLEFRFQNNTFVRTNGLAQGLHIYNVLFAYYIINILKLFYNIINENEKLSCKIFFYVDDILFISNDNNHFVFEKFTNHLKYFNLKLNQNKQGKYIKDMPLIYAGKIFNEKENWDNSSINESEDIVSIYQNNRNYFNDILKRLINNRKCLNNYCLRCSKLDYFRKLNNLNSFHKIIKLNDLCNVHRDIYNSQKIIKMFYLCRNCHEGWIQNNTKLYNETILDLSKILNDGVYINLKNNQKSILEFSNKTYFILNYDLASETVIDNIKDNLDLKILKDTDYEKTIKEYYLESTIIYPPSICQIFKIYHKTRFNSIKIFSNLFPNHLNKEILDIINYSFIN